MKYMLRHDLKVSATVIDCTIAYSRAFHFSLSLGSSFLFDCFLDPDIKLSPHSATMDDFLESIERDARKILHASNERRIKSAKGEYDGLASSPVVKKQNASSSKSLSMSPSELASLSNKAIALSSPKRQPLTPSSRPVEPSGITSRKVMRGLSSSSGSPALGRKFKAAASSARSSPFLGSPLELDPPKNTKQSSFKQKTGKQEGSSSKSLTTAPSPVRRNITKKQLSSSLAVSSTSGSTTDQAGGGPIDLDIEILRKKYRCEQTRAEAHDAYVKRVELRALVNGNGIGGDGQDDCLVVAEDEPPVEKHPIQARVEELVKRENERARERSRRKLESNAWEMEVRKECLSELDKLRDEERRAIRMDGKDDDSCKADERDDTEEHGEPPDPLCNDVDPGPSEKDIIRNPSPNLSMKLAGGDLHELSTLIPGCATIGPVGGLHRVGGDGNTDTDQDATALKDRTQAVACFTRDPTTSAPKVTIAQAIETPMLAEPTIAFDPTQIKPPPAQHEKPSGIMPDVYPPNDIIDRNPLVSPIADARPSTIVVLDPNATEEDYASAISVDDGGTPEGPRIQHRRHMKEVTTHGFPTKCYAAPFEVDAPAVTHDFGITEEGITMPEPAVSGILTSLPGECTTESLSTEKTPLDYLYIAKDPSSGKDGGTPNEGSLFTVLMNNYEISSIVRTTERKQQAEQDRLQQAQAENRKKAEMRAKIKAATELMERKLATEREKILRQEAPGGHDHVASEGEVTTKDSIEPSHEDDGEEAWERRMKCSVIVTVRDIGDVKWEERQLMDIKKRFYRNVDPCMILSDASSWDPPPGWDRVALPAPDISDCGKERVGMDVTENVEMESNHDEPSGESKDGGENDDEIGRLATLLTKNDEFVKTMAARLGVPEDKVRSLGGDSHGNSDNNGNKIGSKDIPASEEFHTDDIHKDLEMLPQGFADVYAIKCAERERQQSEGRENIDPRDLGGGARGYEWRKLPRAIVGADFFHLNKRKIQSCADKSSFCQPNKPKLVGLVDPVKGIQREVDENKFQTELTTLFISDIKADHIKMVDDEKKQKEQEESLLDASQQEALDQILSLSVDDGGGTSTADAAEIAASPGSTSAKPTLYLLPEIVDLQSKSNVELTLAAIDAVKSANYNVLEHILDEIGLSVNCRDEHGNTLLIIAAQRASKRMVKFLLRRNANMNAQNFVGCTALHYLYGYGHDRLAEYLLSKGASDDVINKAGLTVYEGLGHSPDD